MADTPFVLQTGTKENNKDQDTRKFIRRHVMLGRNQGRTTTRIPKRPPNLEGYAIFRQDDWGRIDQPPTESQIPRRVGSDLSFLSFADSIPHPLMHDTLQFCTATDEKLFVLERCVSFSSDDVAAMCVQLLSSDRLHFHVMVFGVQAYIDQISRQTATSSEVQKGPSRAMLRHYGQALFLLRERLAAAERQHAVISDMTFMSVTTLTMHAVFTGDVESAKNHLTGMKRLVSMRDRGIYSFSDKTKLMMEILRCDISVSLATGQLPLFFSDSFLEPILELPELPDTLDHMPRRCPAMANNDLARTWDVLSRFCCVINESATNRRKIPDRILLEVMASALYRLLGLSTTLGSTDRLICLAMLSFCASAFLNWRHLRISFDWLQVEFRRSLVNLARTHTDIVDFELVLWCLTVYDVVSPSLPVNEDDELRSLFIEVVDLCELTIWDSVKSIVSDYLWIGFICSRPAQELVEKILVL